MRTGRWTLALAIGAAFFAGCGEDQVSAQGTPASLSPPLPQANGPAAPGQTAAPPPAWPRTFQKGDDTIILYQPQVDAWKDYAKIRFRAAVAVVREGDPQPQYGVVAAQADTLVDHDARTVLMTNLDVAVRFQGLPEDKAGALKKLVKECLPGLNYVDVSLDQVLAHMHADTKIRTTDVSLKPPPIFYSDVPAILVIYLGPPQFKPIQGAGLMFAINTNWVVLMDMTTSQYYLLSDGSWLTSPDPLTGPWTAAKELPAGFSKLPVGGNWDDVKKSIPGKPLKSVPRVLASQEPAELILTVGPPDYTPIEGTRLMYVSNPGMPLFLDLIDSHFYYLIAGRWFRSQNLTGPWTAASADLPAEFAKIPVESPMGYVLASVPRTQEAQDAVLLASVPHKATVNAQTATVTVTYDGPPKFAPIQGTSMQYAVNTPYEVVQVADLYYCCYQGVWFTAPSPAGPWAATPSVPAAVYTIPPSCPIYNVTYVQVYSSTPDSIVCGYTDGYCGEYVAGTGALVFGAGMVAGAALAGGWYQCCPCYYSYGCAAHYSYAYGGYYRAGGAYYGPHGGAGWGSAYNPATGTWARAGYAYGPAGAHWGAQAYNPFTNTFAQHTGGTNGYQSWGSTAVSQDGKWAQAGHVSGAAGTAGWAETSSGKEAAGVHAGNTTVAKTSSGDVYAGHDGQVYKNTGSGWQKYQGGGSWSDVPAATPHSGWQQSASDAKSESSWQSQVQNRAQPAAQSAAGSSWKSDWNSSGWKSSWESPAQGGVGASSMQDRWGQHDTMQGLNSDSWARGLGNSNAFSSFQSRSGGGGFGGGRFGGGGGGFGGFHGGRR